MGEAAFVFPKRFLMEVTEGRLCLHFLQFHLIKCWLMIKINHSQHGLPPPAITEQYFTFTLCCAFTDILDFTAFINSDWTALGYKGKTHVPHSSIHSEEEKGDMTCLGHLVRGWQGCEESPGPQAAVPARLRGDNAGLGQPEGNEEGWAPHQGLQCSCSSEGTSEESCRNPALLQDQGANWQGLLAIGHQQG